MKMHLLALTAAVTLSACSRNPDPEYAPDSDDAAPVAVAPAAETPAVVAPAPDAARLSEAETMRLGREAAALVFANDIDALWPRLDAQVQTQAQSAENFRAMTEQIFGQIGEEMNVVEEVVETPEEFPALSVYRRRGHFMAIGQDLNLSIAFNADGTIGGLTITPAE